MSLDDCMNVNDHYSTMFNGAARTAGVVAIEMWDRRSIVGDWSTVPCSWDHRGTRENIFLNFRVIIIIRTTGASFLGLLNIFTVQSFWNTVHHGVIATSPSESPGQRDRILGSHKGLEATIYSLPGQPSWLHGTCRNVAAC